MSEKIKWKNTGGSFRMADGREIRRGEIFEAADEEIPKAFRDIIRPLASLPKVEALIFKHRRYPEGENYDYDLAFESRFNGSTILNEKNRNYMDPGTWQMASKSGMVGLVKELEGQAERAVALLGTMDTELENRKVTARRQGAAEPVELPQDLKTLKLETEARIDVTREELDYLRNILAGIEAREEKERDAKYLLTRGPGGAGKLRNGVLSEIDGQPVKVNRKGVLIIDCPKSPYHKMALVDYKEHVVKPFQKWRSQPPTKEERELGPHAPPRGGGVAWEDLPPRPPGF